MNLTLNQIIKKLVEIAAGTQKSKNSKARKG